MTLATVHRPLTTAPDCRAIWVTAVASAGSMPVVVQAAPWQRVVPGTGTTRGLVGVSVDAGVAADVGVVGVGVGVGAGVGGGAEVVQLSTVSLPV